MAVVAKIEYAQSPDGKTLTLIDASDYTTGNINNYTRTVQLYSGKDGTGDLITTLNFVGAALTVDYAITKDQYFSAKLNFVGSPAVASVYSNFTTREFELNALYKNTNKGCGCQSKNCSPTFYGFIDMYLAQTATKAGNSGLANSLISGSAAWLK